MSMLTRRQLIQSAAYGTAFLLAGCGNVAEPSPQPETPTPVPDPTATPTPSSTPTPDDAGLDPVTDIDLEVKIGQMFMVGFRGLAVDGTHPIIQDIQQRHLGGVVLFDYDVPNGEFVRNIQSPSQLQALNDALQAASQIPLLIAVDQEGGQVARLNPRAGFPPTLSHQALGELDDIEETFAQASEMARTLADVGINQNLAPVVDLNVNPTSPAIGAYERSFGADAAKVAAHASAFIEAHHTHNVLCTLKHFPGHGSATGDSHQGFVDVTETWSHNELTPYATLIQAGLADAVMTAHVFNRQWDETDPATLSPAVITGMLREELAFNDVIFSDDMQMGAIRQFYTFDEAIRKALEAGVDVIAIANNSVYDDQVMARGVAVVQQLVAKGIISPERIDASFRRISALKATLP